MRPFPALRRPPGIPNGWVNREFVGRNRETGRNRKIAKAGRRSSGMERGITLRGASFERCVHPRFSMPARTGIRLRLRERGAMECRPCNFSSESMASEDYNIILWYRHNTGTPEDSENRESTGLYARRRRHEATAQRHVDRSGTFCGHAVQNSLRTPAARWEQGSRPRASQEDESL